MTHPTQSTSQFVVTEAGACRLIALNAYAAWAQGIRNPRPTPGADVTRDPKPGDLVLETTTAFRWIGHDRTAPGEALGWLLRIEDEHLGEYHKVWVVRPIYEPEGVEFRWSNCKMIRVWTEMLDG